MITCSLVVKTHIENSALKCEMIFSLRSGDDREILNVSIRLAFKVSKAKLSVSRDQG